MAGREIAISDLVALRKGGYYYRPNWAGYTGCPHEAGVYYRAEAERHVAKTEGVSIVEFHDMARLPNPPEGVEG